MGTIALDYDARIPGRVLRDAGITEVFRYLTDLDHPKDWPKGLTQDEVDDLRACGVKIWLNRETTATFMLGGYAAGHAQAEMSRGWARRLGFADYEPIIYSADFQSTPATRAIVSEFNRGAGNAEGRRDVVWNYGDYFVVKQCLDQGYGGGWQITNSWSEGIRDSRAYAFQRIEQRVVGGIKCDVNDISEGVKVMIGTIPAGISAKWPSLAADFPANGTFDDATALIYADAAARYAAYGVDRVLEAVKGIQVGGTSGLSDADVDKIAEAVVKKLGTVLGSA